jgi:hypothetical protein
MSVKSFTAIASVTAKVLNRTKTGTAGSDPAGEVVVGKFSPLFLFFFFFLPVLCWKWPFGGKTPSSNNTSKSLSYLLFQNSELKESTKPTT